MTFWYYAAPSLPQKRSY